MKRFRFNLEVLLRVYRLHEEDKKKKLAAANRELLAAEQELTRLGNDYDDSQERERAVREKNESVSQMKLYVQYMFELKRSIERQKITVRDKFRLVKTAREQLVEAMRRVKALERLKERRHEVWLKDRRRYEMKQLDDLCSLQFIRQTREASLA